MQVRKCPSMKLSKTKGTKSKGVGNTKAKKMGAKSSSRKMPGQLETVSSQPGILEYFGKGASLVEVGIPTGIETLLQKPAGKEWNSSVLFRPVIKKEVFMTRDFALEIKLSETG